MTFSVHYNTINLSWLIRDFYRYTFITIVLLIGCASPSMEVYTLNSGLLRVGFNKLRTEDGQLFYLYLPSKVEELPKGSRILVSIHGSSGKNANDRGEKKVKKAAKVLTDLADKNDWVILAPQFDRDRFNNDYQRLNFFGSRADVNLNRLIKETGRLLPGIITTKIFLFGFSGGGQFVHRYAAFNPDRIDRAVAGGAGWYMWPDKNLPYPIGISPKSFVPGVKPHLRKLCTLNLYIIVGDGDSTQGIVKRRYRNYDLLILQGEGRRERARNWVAALHGYAATNGWPCKARLGIIPGTGHSRSDELVKSVEEYLSRK